MMESLKAKTTLEPSPLIKEKVSPPPKDVIVEPAANNNLVPTTSKIYETPESFVTMLEYQKNVKIVSYLEDQVKML